MLHAEVQGRGADQSGLAAEFGGHDPQVADEVEPRVGVQRLAERVEQQRAGFGHSSADDDEVEVAHRADRRDHRGHRRRTALEGPQRNRVTRSRGVGQFLGVGVGGRIPPLVAGPLRHPRTGGDRLDATAAAARARPTVRVDDDVADVPGVARSAVIRRAVEHQSAADAGGHHHAEQELRAAARAAPPLPHRHAEAVPAQPHRRVDDR